MRALTYTPLHDTPKYTDGSATGRRGEVEAPTILIETAEGRAALLRYAATKKGKSRLPSICPRIWRDVTRHSTYGGL